MVQMLLLTREVVGEGEGRGGLEGSGGEKEELWVEGWNGEKRG